MTTLLPDADIDRRMLRPAFLGREVVWSAAATLAALVVALPCISIFVLALSPTENIWGHLASTVLPLYVGSSLLLMAGVGLGTLVIGTGAAWLVAMCRFPGRRIFAWALFLPLAMPAYVVAYTVTDLLEFAGPVQGALREVFGWSTRRDYWFPEIRSMGSAIAVLTLVLYPYVYAMARAAFVDQCVCVLEVSRTLGRSAWSSFLGVALPLARPALAAGVTLALMETLNDFGTVDFFAVKTLTAGVFDVWYGTANPGGAAQIAMVLLGFIVALVGIERAARNRRRFHHTGSKMQALPGYRLAGWRGWAAAGACALPILLGFVLPAAVLARHAWRDFGRSWSPEYFGYAANSLTLAAAAAGVTVALAVLLGYARRLRPSRLVGAAVRLASVGYAVPGAVVAIGVLIPAGLIDNAVDGFLRAQFGVSSGLLLSGTAAALVFAYVARFMAAAYGAVDAGLAKVTPSMDAAARTLGQGPLATLRRIHLPMIRGSLLTAGVLVFVDTMKELPATLVLRPFNFDTLATYVYQFASAEQLERCALAALTIVAAGVVPVVLLSRAVAGSRPGHRPQ